MKRERSTIIYLFIILIILVGLGLFVFKDNLADRFLVYDNPGAPISGNQAANTFNLDILRDSRIKELKNYVTVFNYDDMNKSQEAMEAASNNSGSEVIISNPDETGTSTESVTPTNTFSRVRVGNSNPFIVNKAR